METITDKKNTEANAMHYDQREAVLTQVITSLPDVLARCEDVEAATIIAGLLRAHMARRAPEVETADDDLDSIIRKAREEAEGESDDY
jgi:hypothetical protein